MAQNHVDELELVGCIGFGGNIKHSLLLHTSDTHIIYPIGSTIVIKNVEDPSKQTLLQGHSQKVTCMSLSKDGTKLASGQLTHMGYLADIILWDISGVAEGIQPQLLHRLQLHKVEVKSLDFSCDGEYLASLGGEDDNNLIIWDVASGLAVCGSPASHDVAHTCKWLNNNPRELITGGAAQLRVWEFSLETRKVRPTECALGKQRRAVTSIALMPDDSAFFVGTCTGDVVKVSLSSKRICGASRTKLMKGVTTITFNSMCASGGEVLAGSGDGQIVTMDCETLGVTQETRVSGSVTSLVLDTHGEYFFAGTDQGNLYLAQYAKLICELKGTNHNAKINDVAFPHSYDQVFATCSASDIRVWHQDTMGELLRIQVPNLNCNCITFPADGTSILSGWSDGKIRAFGPQSGNLLFVIEDAHRLIGVGNSSGGIVPTNGVTAVCPTNDCKKLLSGGADGKVRVWALHKGTQVMLASMQEHKGPISTIAVKADDTECVSASADGSCIVWALSGLHPYTRISALFAANFFTSAQYFPDESQLLTCGTDRKITYWDITNMNAIRIVDGSEDAAINAMSIEPDGRFFVTGGADMKVSLWGYNDGSKYFEGKAHSGAVQKVVVAPGGRNILSVGTEGSICIWRTPSADRLPK